MVFPEGQVHNYNQYLLRSEKFCFGLNQPILPIAPKFQYPWPLNFWIANENQVFTWLLLLFVPWVHWDYRILPLTTQENEEKDHTFAQRIQHTTAKALGISPTSFTLNDVANTLNNGSKP